jgi:hypothetical protein
VTNVAAALEGLKKWPKNSGLCEIQTKRCIWAGFAKGHDSDGMQDDSYLSLKRNKTTHEEAEGWKGVKEQTVIRKGKTDHQVYCRLDKW